jgi:hypothetical protein
MNDAGEVKFSVRRSRHPRQIPPRGVTDLSPSREKSLQTRSEALTAAVHSAVEEIEARAYQIYIERGGADGHDGMIGCKRNVSYPKNTRKPSGRRKQQCDKLAILGRTVAGRRRERRLAQLRCCNIVTLFLTLANPVSGYLARSLATKR